MTDDTRRATTPTVDAPITDGGRSANEWVDLHLTDPAPGSWEVDVQVERGAVETVLLRLHADGLPGVVNSLLADADDELVHRVLAYVVDRQGVDPATLAPDE